jgi:hypothetical protein
MQSFVPKTDSTAVIFFYNRRDLMRGPHDFISLGTSKGHNPALAMLLNTDGPKDKKNK